MSYHWTFLAVLFAATPVLADPPKSNTLTAQEIADGWILLFDGETTFGWKIEGQSEVKDGALVLGGEKETTAILHSAFQSFSVVFESQVERLKKDPEFSEFWALHGKVRVDAEARLMAGHYRYA